MICYTIEGTEDMGQFCLTNQSIIKHARAYLSLSAADVRTRKFTTLVLIPRDFPLRPGREIHVRYVGPRRQVNPAKFGPKALVEMEYFEERVET